MVVVDVIGDEALSTEATLTDVVSVGLSPGGRSPFYVPFDGWVDDGDSDNKREDSDAIAE